MRFLLFDNTYLDFPKQHESYGRILGLAADPSLDGLPEFCQSCLIRPNTPVIFTSQEPPYELY